jgi:hypothetical protein
MERVVVLGEDRAHRDFTRGLCASEGWDVVDESFPAPGVGAGSAWVLDRIDELSRELPTSGETGLIVIIDGDGHDWIDRRRMLAGRCERHALDHRVAILVPAWSIETWALYFYRGVAVREGQAADNRATSLKRSMPGAALAPGVDRRMLPPATFKPRVLQSLVDGFLGDRATTALPSLSASRISFWSI